MAPKPKAAAPSPSAATAAAATPSTRPVKKAKRATPASSAAGAAVSGVKKTKRSAAAAGMADASAKKAKRVASATPAKMGVATATPVKTGAATATLTKASARAKKAKRAASSSPAKPGATAAAPAKTGAAADAPATASAGAKKAKRAPAAAAEADADAPPPGLEVDQVALAVAALLQHVAGQAAKADDAAGAALVDSDTDVPVSVILGFKLMPDRARVRPLLLRLSTPLYTSGVAEVCLIVKDPQRAVKDYFAAAGDSGGVTRVMGLEKLRKRYRTFEAKRELMNQYDLFLADDRVEPLLPKLLGSPFFRSKKVPMSVRLSRNPVKEAKRALHSTALHLSGGGSCVAVKAGHTGMTPAALAGNVVDVLRGVAAKAPRGWTNVLSVHIKTPDSVALPVYYATVAPEDLAGVAPTAGAAEGATAKVKAAAAKGKQM